MTNALNALRLRWRDRERELELQYSRNCASKQTLEVHQQCIQELLDTVADVRPLPLNEASTEKLYNWAPRMITIMDLMIRAREVKDDPKRGDIALAVVAHELAELADQAFLNELYDLFKQLANRGTK